MARGEFLSTRTDVLVAGAGPAGLATALQARAHGAVVRVVERRTEPFRPSRAMIMHPRTLESLRPLGVTAALLARGDRTPSATLHLGQRSLAVELGDVALSDTPFPHLTLLRQMDVETVLIEALQKRGVEVEWGVELTHASSESTTAHATLRRRGLVEEVTCAFVVGCDGPDSTVRDTAGIGWQGGPYREEVILADVELAQATEGGSLQVVANRSGLVFLFALGERATWRLMATRPMTGDVRAPFGQTGRQVPAHELQQLLDTPGLRANLTEVRWSARVHLQHRLADSFRAGRLFLAGDAAHTHSPAGAQGMNTGILDGVNLGWKLAFAANGGDHEKLLESYDRERRPVARQVLALTHLIFFAEASTGRLPSLLRGTALPLAAPVIPMLTRQRYLMAMVIRLLSQGWVRYRHSPISIGKAPNARGPHPGDRLPDQDVTCEHRRSRLHDLTARPGIHVLLHRDAAELDPERLGSRVTVHRISSWPGRELLAVRPDGHVGFASGVDDGDDLEGWLELVASPR